MIGDEPIRTVGPMGNEAEPAASESAPLLRLSLVTRHSSLSLGITLLELLVVMTLAAILLAVTFPAIRAGMGTLELRSSAQHLAAAAKYARDQAIFRQRPFELEIDGIAGTIAVFDSAGGRSSFRLPQGVRVETILPPELGFPILRSTTSPGVAATSDASLRTRSFLFTADGNSAPFQIVLENGRRQIKVAADPLTGFPKISE